jgi:hypothetical protein
MSNEGGRTGGRWWRWADCQPRMPIAIFGPEGTEQSPPPGYRRGAHINPLVGAGGLPAAYAIAVIGPEGTEQSPPPGYRRGAHEKPTGGCRRGAHEKPTGGRWWAASRVCQSLLSDPKARSKALFGYAGAERMRNPLVGAGGLEGAG